jgi:hypothetical protein
MSPHLSGRSMLGWGGGRFIVRVELHYFCLMFDSLGCICRVGALITVEFGLGGDSWALSLRGFLLLWIDWTHFNISLNIERRF